MNNQKLNHTFDFVSAIILFFGYLCAAFLILGIATVYQFLAGTSAENKSFFLILSYTLSMIGPVLSYYFLWTKRNNQKIEFSFSLGQFSFVILSFLMMSGMILISEYCTKLIPTDGVFEDWYKMFIKSMDNIAVDNFTLVFLTVILAPVLEELVFRGIILKGIINNGKSPKTAILLSSFVFGAIHFFPWQVVGAFLLGLVLGLVYWKTKSLLLVILLHAFNNLLSAIFVLKESEQSLSEIFGLRPEVLLCLGIFVFAISIYFFINKKIEKKHNGSFSSNT